MNKRLGQLVRGLTSSRCALSRRQKELSLRQRMRTLLHVEGLEDRRLLATLYVDNAADFDVTTDQGAAGLSAGDTVTWDPGAGSQHGSAVAGLTFGTDAFSSIQDAVNAADPGDEIRVGPGTFTEQVTVNEQVSLLGNQVGVDASSASRTGLPATETVVTGPGGTTPFNVTVSDVVIDGFTVEGVTSGTTFGFGIVLGAGTSGSEIRNNIIQNNIAGLSLANASATNQTVIEGNLFRNNNQPGPVSGTGIYTDQFNAGGALTNVLIQDNTFENNDNVAVLIGPTDASLPASNITIADNVMTDNGNGILLFNTLNSAITGNEITGSAGSQIVIGGGVDGLTIANNIIEDGLSRGIRIGDFGGGSANQNITITGNSIEGNAGAGLEIEPGGYIGTLNAENNFWGSASGPTSPENPGGTGQAIIDPNNQVDFEPFLPSGIDADPGTPGFQPVAPLVCEVTTLNTPGVTGSAVLVADADNPDDTALVITGGSGADFIMVQRLGSQIRVLRNGQNIGTFASADVDRIVVFGQNGNDFISVMSSVTQPTLLLGGAGNDVLIGASGADEIAGADGNDTMFGLGGNDIICGGGGNDSVVGGAGDDLLGGDAGNDRVMGDADNDRVLGGEGNDLVSGGTGDDLVLGQEGNDTANGDAGNDVVVGGGGNDRLSGGAGLDILIGGLGNDFLLGDADDDILIGSETDFDAADVALLALMAEWSSGGTYEDRVNNLRAGGGANGTFALDATTVSDDERPDTLLGLGGRDWFLAGSRDRLLDRAGNEFVN